jgi:hypothetical protein
MSHEEIIDIQEANKTPPDAKDDDCQSPWTKNRDNARNEGSLWSPWTIPKYKRKSKCREKFASTQRCW